VRETGHFRGQTFHFRVLNIQTHSSTILPK
jgi:hypothetical protein